MGALEFLLQRVDLLVAEARAVPLELALEAQSCLVIVRAAGDAAGVAVVAAAVRLVRMRATFELRHYEQKEQREWLAVFFFFFFFF